MTVAMDRWAYDRADVALQLLLSAPLDLAAAEWAAMAAGWPSFQAMTGPSTATEPS